MDIGLVLGSVLLLVAANFVYLRLINRKIEASLKDMFDKSLENHIAKGLTKYVITEYPNFKEQSVKIVISKRGE